MDVEDAIRTRRSIRKYQDREVPTELILKAINVACWAPNGGNFQPWKFYVVKNREVIGRIADAVQAKVDLSANWPGMEDMEETLKRFRRNAAFFRSAAVLIGVAAEQWSSVSDRVLRRRGEGDPEAVAMRRNRDSVSSRIQTSAGLTAYLLLALHNLGLGACCMTGPMIVKAEIERMLDIPADMDLFTLVPVGYPAEDPTPGARKPLEEVVRIIE